MVTVVEVSCIVYSAHKLPHQCYMEAFTGYQLLPWCDTSSKRVKTLNFLHVQFVGSDVDWFMKCSRWVRFQ